VSDYRDLDWEMFTGHIFSKKELDEIYEQGITDERDRIIKELEEKLSEKKYQHDGEDYYVGISESLEIVRGEEND